MAGLLNGVRLKRPFYEALDDAGRPVLREAKVIHDLDHKDRRAALDSAANEITKQMGVASVAPIKFGLPVFVAFGMTRAQAVRHEHSSVLLVAGIDIGLEWCKEYGNA